jgi:hypothetical protein
MIKSRMRSAGHVALMGKKRNAYRLLVGKSAGKTPLGRPRRTWVGDIRMDLGRVGSAALVWLRIGTWRAIVNLLMNHGVPQNVGKVSSGFTTGGLGCVE